MSKPEDYTYSPKRIMILSKDIDNKSIAKIIAKIYKFNAEDRIGELEEDYAVSPIHLILNTPGGSIYDGLALIGAIEGSVTPVHVTCLGSAMSMGLYILAVGHVRFANQHATLMYHQSITDVSGKLGNVKNEIKETERIDKLCDEILFRKSKLTMKLVKAKTREKDEWYFSAAEAKRYGVIDFIC